MPKDPLCPLGFHPQTRWPTRCKRCFREYKEHAPKTDEKKDRFEYEYRRRTPFPEDLPASSSDSRSRSSAVSSTISSRQSNDSDTTPTPSKDFSTPYSSISSEAQLRLNRLREASAERKAATTDNLLTPASADSRAPIRRRTTDLSHVIESTSSYNKAPAKTSTTANTYSNNSPKEMPTPPGRRKILTQSSFPEETVTLRLGSRSNSFNLSDGRNSSRENSVSPVPPPRAKTPSLEESPKEPVSKAQLKVPKVKVSDSSDDGREAQQDDSASKPKKLKKKRLLIQGVQEVMTQSPQDESDGSSENSDAQSADVAFIIQVKSTRKKKKDDDDETMSMTTTTDTTETTLVDANEYNQTASGINSWEYEELKEETTRLRDKCDKLEREKAEILSRRVANLEAPKLQSSEYLKLQQRVNQLATTNEDLKDEKKDLEAKVRELETELSSRPTIDLMQRTVAELRSKLSSAEGQIDQILEEKREAIQQMKDMQEEFEEMQDNFREDQSEEFATVKKELDEASKNCRLLQFKLRKVEKRADQLEAEKNDLENRVDSSKNSEKIANLEKELSELKSDYDKLLRESKSKGGMSLSPGVMKKKSPVLTKAPSGEAVDPPIPSDIDSSQLLRDLQSTLERESDLREQLKFAEEEVTSLRQRINRIEDENESLLIQIKKMSAKSRSDMSGGKSHDSQMNGEKLDASELKIQLEINDQESKILRRKVEELENSNGRLSKELQVAEDKLVSLEKGTSSVTKSKSVDEVSLLRRKIIEKEREVERLQTELLAVASKSKNKMIRGKSVEAEDSSKRQEAELRVELKKAQTELSKIKADSESQRKAFQDELAKAQNELDSQHGKVTQLAEMNKNLVLQMEKFKQDMVTMKDQYESIQDDFVIKNSQLSSIKEEKESALQKLRKEYSTIEKELKALRETFNTRQDTWIKEKLAMQEKVRELERKEKQLTSIPGDKDSTRLKHLLDESSKELDAKKHELSAYKDQIVFMQRESDELRRQLEDFEKVSQVQMRSLSLTEPSNRSDHELKLLREKMLAEEKTHRNEMAQMKLRYEQQYALKAEEMSSLQSQLSRAKRERDTFRQMVDSAQRAISELKSRDSSSRRDSVSGLEEAATGARAAVVSLQERIASLEDDLSDARRETSRAKTELATEKSTWEMKLGEMQQKINELEEDRLLGSGRNRAAGQRTRLELAWQKERDEQQRRLKEATTLARDLKTTLLEYERERERDRMENKRRIEQLKGTMEEDQEELRRKIGETQADLLELRDAHAKLRTANEKLRRDREKLEKERDITMKKEIEIRRINGEREKLLEDLTAKIMTSQGSNATAAETIRYLQSIKGLKIPEEPTNYKDRKRSNFLRARSVGDNDERQSQESLKSSASSAYGQEHYGGRNMRYNTNNSSTLTLPSRGRTPVGSTRNVSLDVPGSQSQYNPKGSLYRKSLSLEQTVAMPDEQKIWKGDSEAGSASSIASMEGHQSRGSSVDSRLSTMSSKSEKPKSSSLVKKVKKLVKSKSIEESTTASKVVQAGVKVAGVGSSAGSGVGSDISLNYESDREKPGQKLKDKVKGIFKRSTRSPSVERPKVAPQPPPRSRESTPKKDTPVSTQRPLMPTESQQRPLMPSKR